MTAYYSDENEHFAAAFRPGSDVDCDWPAIALARDWDVNNGVNDSTSSDSDTDRAYVAMFPTATLR